ncbi:sensor histidine kinase [Paramagnetospirillum magneticum]|uniref:histidine kinase n=1 Tax=Paramagnetospirillum magneticum (strain ATCC 700264 / AMB-1) TaxID=342108 RepID=Q2W2M5_PARM1|nr:PAS-domain containing protein [Paramagnetospirillum magneticum]BAE51900.1 Signal transduction histidine kinase [Paramagnetospirillum magneticum AMB-1]
MTGDSRKGAPSGQDIDMTVMQGVLDHLDQGISVFSADLRLILWNRRFTDLHDFPEGFLTHGLGFADIIRFNAQRGEYGSDCDVEATVRHRVDAAMEFQAHRFERTRPNGTILEIIGNPLPGGGFVTTYSDVTVNRQVAENLRDSNDRLDQMVERRTQALQDSEERHRAYGEFLEATVKHMPQGVCLFDNDLNLVVANKIFFDLTQIPASFNVKGINFHEFMLYNAQRGEYGPGDPAELANRRLEIARRMEPHAFDRIRPDGTVIEVRGNPIPGRGFISTFTDITARAKAEESLREAATMARAMLDAPGLLVLLIRMDGTIVDLNQEAATGLSSTKDAMIGANIFTVMPPKVAERRFAYAQQAVFEGHAVYFEDERDGRWFETTMTPYPMDQDGVHRVMIIAHDVTHRHHAEQRLREATAMAQAANRTKTDFLAAMSHELRTPLNAILGFSEIIAREMFGPVGDRYRIYGQDINSAGQHLLAMINDILDISRIEIGAFTLCVEQVNPHELVDSCLRLVTTRAEAAGIRLREDLPETLPSLMIDSRRTKQILINLLGNAVKFTPAGGSVTLRGALQSDGGMAFHVADTGIGMSEADIAIALSPFGQVDTGLDRRFEGAGLGLPLAKSLAELHGGSLEIISTPGEGTTVSVYFPAACVAR